MAFVLALKYKPHDLYCCVNEDGKYCFNGESEGKYSKAFRYNVLLSSLLRDVTVLQ
jgi:hypothetical protein